jgi:hypothetical protein
MISRIACFTLILVGISCLLFTMGSSARQPRQTIEFSITFDKEEYKLREAINITFTLKNKGKEAIYVNKRFFLSAESAKPQAKDVYLEITGPSGERIPCKIDYEIGFPKTDYFKLLEAKAEVSSEGLRNISGYFDFKTAGKYKIIAVYQNVYGPEIGLDTFRGTIKAKPMTIEIIENK